MIYAENAVCLGVASRSYWAREDRLTVCSVFWSEDMGLFRIRPLPARGYPKRWTVYNVGLERPGSDTRMESYRPQLPGNEGRLSAGDAMSAIQPTGATLKRGDRWPLLSQYVIPGTHAANEGKTVFGKAVSLGIVLPVSAPTVHLAAKDLRIKWQDSEGTKHDTKLLDESSRILMEVRNGTLDRLATNLGLANAPALLIGNYDAHRTAWGVITVLNAVDRNG